MTDKRNTQSQQMFGMIEDWQRSGVSKKEFCKTRQIAEWKFYYWLKQYKEKDQNSTGHFVPVKTERVTQTQAIATGIEIQYPNGVKLVLPAGTGIQVIRTMVGLI